MKKNAIYIASHGITFLAGFVLTIMLPKILSVSEYAQLSIEIALLNILLPIAAFGLTPYIIRTFPKQDDITYNLRDTVYFLFIIGNFIAFGGVVLISLFRNDTLNFVSLSVLILAIVFTSLGTVASGLYRAKKDAVKYFMIVVSSKTLLLVCVLGSFYTFNDWTVEYYFVSLLISAALAILICQGDVLPSKYLNKKTTLADCRKSLYFCFPIVLSNVLVMAVPFLERSIIDVMLLEEELAQYVFNFEVSAKFSAIVLLSIKILIWPNIVDKLEEKEKVKFKKYGYKIILILTGVVSLICFFGETTYEYVVGVFINKFYINFEVFSFAIIFAALNVLLYYINLSVLLSGKTYIMTFGCVLILSSHYFGLIYLIPIYGIAGASISAILSTTFGIIFSIVLNNKYFFTRKR